MKVITAAFNCLFITKVRPRLKAIMAELLRMVVNGDIFVEERICVTAMPQGLPSAKIPFVRYAFHHFRVIGKIDRKPFARYTGAIGI